MPMQSEAIFTRDFLTSLSNWQRGWSENQERRRIIADELVEQCKKLPDKFKTVNDPCYRKRFVIEGEVTPILIDDNFPEGIASWTTELEYAKRFKGMIRPSTKFIMVFKHFPQSEEVVVNIIALWKDVDFVNAANKFQAEDCEAAKALFNFKDSQSEIILRSTLRGSEIEDMVTISSSFEDLCDMAEIPEDKRIELSIKYARDPNGIPIEIPTFAGTRPTKKAIEKTLDRLKKMLETARENNIFIDWSNVAKPNKDDLKHVNG